MNNLEQTRSAILQESDVVSSKRRFGLFSQPLTTAVGDDSPYKTKIHPRDQMGKPVTLPRNFQTSPGKKGALSKSYFGPLNPLAQSNKHDTFLEENVRLLKEDYDAFNKGRKQSNFNSVSIQLPRGSSAYPYIEQKNPEHDPKRYKMENGRVRVGPRNFYTNSDKKVMETLFKTHRYIDDPYERQHDQEIERLKQSKSKQKEDAFKPNSFVPQVLNKDSKIYGSDVQFDKKKDKMYASSIHHHQTAWKPNSHEKAGRNGMFKPVHPYIENPPPVRQGKFLPAIEKQGFRGMSPSLLSTPTPSVSLNKVNLQKIIRRSISPRR